MSAPLRWIIRESWGEHAVSELHAHGPSVPEGEIMVMPVVEHVEALEQMRDEIHLLRLKLGERT